jgi:alkanesulfonate monooxygenase SsuD/methylene tetrahydromethanopterin reductase-like flavin-dependent oxidoreductase (luciferase family)
MKRQLHLNLFISGKGHHEASWRHPDSSSLPSTDIRYLQGLSQRAEEGLFDSIFLADQLAFQGGGAQLKKWNQTILPQHVGKVPVGIVYQSTEGSMNRDVAMKLHGVPCH